MAFFPVFSDAEIRSAGRERAKAMLETNKRMAEATVKNLLPTTASIKLHLGMNTPRFVQADVAEEENWIDITLTHLDRSYGNTLEQSFSRGYLQSFADPMDELLDTVNSMLSRAGWRSNLEANGPAIGVSRIKKKKVESMGDGLVSRMLEVESYDDDDQEDASGGLLDRIFDVES